MKMIIMQFKNIFKTTDRIDIRKSKFSLLKMIQISRVLKPKWNDLKRFRLSITMMSTITTINRIWYYR